MPSWGEIFGEVAFASEVPKVSGVSMGARVGMTGAGVGVFSGTGIAVEDAGVAAL